MFGQKYDNPQAMTNASLGVPIAQKANPSEILQHLLMDALAATEQARELEMRAKSAAEEANSAQSRAMNAWEEFAKALSMNELAPVDLRERLNGGRSMR